MIEIFGAGHKDLIGTVDAERDRELRAKFAKAAMERRRFRFNDDDSVTMVVGFEAWPFPIPIVKADAGWRFDTDAGVEEVVKRRIGENELSAIAALRAYVEAQRDTLPCRATARMCGNSRKSCIVRRTKKTGSTGRRQEGEEPSPAGPEIKDAKTPHAGYHFKILTAQGAAAPAGKYSYVINGKLIGGFAMIAWPADYGKTGVMTLLVNHYGDVYEKDLGAKTAKLAPEIDEYNPDKTWNKVAE